MKKMSTFLFTIGLLTTSLFGQCYLQPNLGLSVHSVNQHPDLKLSYNVGFSMGLLGGYEVYDNISLEAEAFYKYNSFDKVTVQDFEWDGVGFFHSYGVLAGGKWTFAPIDDVVSIYIGLSVGMERAYEEIELSTLYVDQEAYSLPMFKDSHCCPCVQGKIGVNCPSLEGKATSRIEYNVIKSCKDFTQHSLTYNIRWTI